MADPRFYDNRGPFTLAEVCACAHTAVPEGADGKALVYDVASLACASCEHLSFFASEKAGAIKAREAFSNTLAGFCFVPDAVRKVAPPPATVPIPCASVHHAFAAAARWFYPESSLAVWRQTTAIDPTAEIDDAVEIGPGVVIGPHAEIGSRTRIGPNTVIGRGVAIGRDCEIGSNVSISHAYIGDGVLILPGARIGQPGFGFANAPEGHTKIPQLGRVIVQDRVEIGSSATIDRGALSDTVIGEGSKLDNLVQIGHNVHIGRHTIIVSQCGVSGSTEIGDFVIFGGQVGIADHCKIGSNVRLAGRTAMTTGQVIENGRDYAGVPAKPLMDWIREIYAVAALIKKPKRESHD
jgi:UDP-3-O-[3-hydroxymyristoyl] glucosamine N-acyltransferase